MQIRYTIVDDFLDDFAAVRKAADKITFKDETNPVDGVVYPHIFRDIPPGLAREIETKLMLLVSRPIVIKTMFVRLSPLGVNPPHFAHTDAVMGDYSAMLYLNRQEHCQGGTAVLRHESGMDLHPSNAAEVATWTRDTNDESKWMITDYCPMAPNRIFLFRSDLFHAALSRQGFGSNARDGRMVLTVFFNVGDE